MSDGIVRHGVHRALEDAADALLKESLKGVTSMAEKSDILTPWKAEDRKKREILVRDGVPDAAVRQGIFGRAYNPDMPHLNAREGLARGSRFGASLREHVAEHQQDLGTHLGEAGFD